MPSPTKDPTPSSQNFISNGASPGTLWASLSLPWPRHIEMARVWVWAPKVLLELATSLKSFSWPPQPPAQRPAEIYCFPQRASTSSCFWNTCREMASSLTRGGRGNRPPWGLGLGRLHAGPVHSSQGYSPEHGLHRDLMYFVGTKTFSQRNSEISLVTQEPFPDSCGRWTERWEKRLLQWEWKLGSSLSSPRHHRSETPTATLGITSSGVTTAAHGG